MDRSRNSEQSNNREFTNLPNYHRQLVSRLDRETPSQRTDQGKGKELAKDVSTGKAASDHNTAPHCSLFFSQYIDGSTGEVIDVSIGKATSGAAESVPGIIELSDSDDTDHPRMKRGESAQRLFEKVNPTVLGGGQEENDKPRELKSILKKPTESPKPKADQSKHVRFANPETNTFQIASQQEGLLGKRKMQQNDQFPQITKKSNELQEIGKEINFHQKLYQGFHDRAVALNQDIHEVIKILSKHFEYFKENPPKTNSLESISGYNVLIDPNKQLKSQYKNISNKVKSLEQTNQILIDYLKDNKDKTLDEQHPNFVYHSMINRLVDRYDGLSANIKFSEQKLQKLEKEFFGKQKMQQDDQFAQITETQIREMENERQKLWEAGQLDQTFHQNLRQVLQIREMKLNLEIQQRIPKEFSSIFDYFKENPHKINDLESIPEYKNLFDRKKQLNEQHEETLNMIKDFKEYRLQVDQTVINYLENGLSQIRKALSKNQEKINYYHTINELADRQHTLHKEIEDNKQKLKEANEEFREYTSYFDILRSDIGNDERT